MRSLIPALLSVTLITAAIQTATVQAAVHYEFRQITRSDVEGVPAADYNGRAVVDGNRSRVDFSGPSIYPAGDYVISLEGSKRIIIIDPKKKAFTEVNVAGIAAAMGNTDIRVNNLHSDYQKLDDHPIVAGLPTDHYRVQTSYDMTLMFGSIPLKQNVNTVIDKWTTAAFGDIDELYLAGGAPHTGNADLDSLIDNETSKIKGFPLRQLISITTAADYHGANSQLQTGSLRKQVSETVVTSISSGAVEESYFEIPPGFSKAQPEQGEKGGVHRLSLEPSSKPN